MTDVIIVGGGIAGCSAAYYLAADGVCVTLLERQEPNALASGANAGSLHAQIPREPFLELGPEWARRFASMIPFCLESIRLWRAAAETLDADLEVSQDGGIIVAANVDQLRQIEAKSRIEHAAGLPIEMLDKAALRRLAPYISERMLGGAYCPVEDRKSVV